MIERLLWNVFSHVEGVTFVLVWIVIPLAFLACFLWLRGAAVPVAAPVVKVVPKPVVEVKPMEPLPEDPKVNLNEANA